MRITFDALKTSIKKLKKIPWLVATNAFSVILLLVFLNIGIGVFLFYRYVIAVTTREPEVIQGTVKFSDNAYQEMLEKWDAKEERFRQSSNTQYINPFI